MVSLLFQTGEMGSTGLAGFGHAAWHWVGMEGGPAYYMV